MVHVMAPCTTEQQREGCKASLLCILWYCIAATHQVNLRSRWRLLNTLWHTQKTGCRLTDTVTKTTRYPSFSRSRNGLERGDPQ